MKKETKEFVVKASIFGGVLLTVGLTATIIADRSYQNYLQELLSKQAATMDEIANILIENIKK